MNSKKISPVKLNRGDCILNVFLIKTNALKMGVALKNAYFTFCGIRILGATATEKI